MVFAQLGMVNALCVLGGMGLGWLVDSLVHTLPLFLLLGLVLGVAAGVAATWEEIKDYL